MMELHPFTPLKLLRHSDRIEAMLRGEETFPISVELDVSNSCNHDCPFCSFGTSASHGYRQQNWVQLPGPRALDLIAELEDCGVKSVTLTGGGEPLVHKHIEAIIRGLNASTMEWGLVTNGSLLKGAIVPLIARGATFVRVSLDAGSDATHQITHGVKTPQYSSIIENLRQLRRASTDYDRPHLTIGASFCVMDTNFKEIYKAAKDTREAGADYLEVRPTFPTDWRGDGWPLTALTQVEEAKTELAHARLHLSNHSFQVIGMIERFDALTGPIHQYDQCRIGPLMTVIGATGDVIHCCVQRGQPFFTVAEIRTKGFREAWKDALAKKMSERIDVSKCPRCRYMGYNELIDKAFVHGDALHASFV